MKIRPNKSVLFLYVFVVLHVKCDYYLSGSISATTPSISLNYSIGSSSSAATVFFKINNQAFSNLALLVDINPIGNLNITAQSLSNYYLKSNAILQQMDILRVNGGFNQLISMRFPNGTNTLYFMLYNLDLPNTLTNKTYTMQIATSSIGTIYCYDCPQGAKLTLVNGACQCSPCPDDNYGPACEFYSKTIQKDSVYNASFYKAGNLYFRIVNPPKTILLTARELTSLNITTLYWQYEVVVGSIAGPLNTYHDSNNEPFNLLVTRNTSTFTIDTKGQNISLTVTCRQQVNAIVQLGYSDPNETSSTTSVGLIVGLGLGIPLAIVAILLVIFCLFCRKRAHVNVPKNALVNQYLLTQQEINRYLPQVPSQLALKYPALQQSRQNLAAEQGKDREKEHIANQCCICLAQIVQKERIRVGYCRHFFHSKCLLGWFAKNQSCPYCRMEFNYSQTLLAYLKIKNQGQDLTGEKLVKAILNVQQQQIAEQELKIAEKQLKKQQQKQLQPQSSMQLGESGPTSSNQRYRKGAEPQPIPNIEAITASLGEFQVEQR